MGETCRSPTPGQAKSVLAFILASEECGGQRGVVELGERRLSRYAFCLSKKISEKRKEIEEWARNHPKEFERVYQDLRRKINDKNVDAEEIKTKLLKAIIRKMGSGDGIQQL